MKYKCCNCKSIFEGTKAVDGYSLGFKKGFLCPVCNTNIQAAPLHLPKLNGGFLIWIFLFVWIPLPIIWKFFFEEVTKYRIQNITGYLIIIIVLAFFFLNRKNKEALVMMTKRISADNE